jgi:hypothetical protein
MLYVQRDEQGQLLRIEAANFAGATETLAADAQEVQAWYADQQVESSLLHLKQSDLDMIRVLDDLLQLLVRQGTLRITDLPAAAQAKLLGRVQSRSALSGRAPLINDDETGVI